ncbi:MAG: efflux RND transporter periplasmic adaptor subunit [Limnobacter sp.]|nr:efflux RND transporter periplasmic adaptor subunit [Limnobacter sp.]
MSNTTPSNDDTSANAAVTERSRKRTIIQIVLTVVVLAIALLGAQMVITSAPKTEKRAAPPKPSRLVNTSVLKKEDVQVEVLGFGVVKPDQQTNLQARVSGVVKQLGAKFVPGTRVQKGEVLVVLDDTDYKLDLANANATLAQAKASLSAEMGNQAVAKSDLDALALTTTEAEKSLILRQPQLEAAKAAVASAQASVKRAELNLERTVIRAPFDGLIIGRDTSLGGQVSPTSVLGSMASSRAFWVNVAIPQADLQWISFPESGKKGSAVCVNDASAQSTECHKGYVLSLQGFVQDNGRQAQVLVEIPAQGMNPKAVPMLVSQYVEARIQGVTLPDVFKLNPRLVHEDTVWINKQGTLEIRKVPIAFRSAEFVLIRGDLNVQADSGIQEGEEIVTSNLSAPIEDMAIRTADSKAKEKPKGKEQELKP